MIYLSSYRVGDNADALRTYGGRAGIIMNALDVYGDTRMRNWNREASDLERLGYSSEEVDLRAYFDDPDGLVHRLERLDLVWVVGGNSFVLARAMALSRFGHALRPALKRGLVYAGYSAGACVAGPDLRGIELIDDPDALPDGYRQETQAWTLQLIPFRIVPHVDSDHPESADAARVMDLLDRLGLPYKPLRDGDAIVLEAPGEGEVLP